MKTLAQQPNYHKRSLSEGNSTNSLLSHILKPTGRLLSIYFDYALQLRQLREQALRELYFQPTCMLLFSNDLLVLYFFHKGRWFQQVSYTFLWWEFYKLFRVPKRIKFFDDVVLLSIEIVQDKIEESKKQHSIYFQGHQHYIVHNIDPSSFSTRLYHF